MKRALGLAILFAFAFLSLVAAQTQSTGQKTLAATLGVFVYPAKGQTPEQQSQDEVECYNWAVQNTGTDPFDLAKQAQQQQQQSAAAKEQAQDAGKGAGARGAVGGAAAGALIGEIVNDDPGKGAAWGAAAGAVAGRRQRKSAQKSATQQVDQQAQSAKQATEQEMENFRKAFGVCLEAKDYMVK
jgi:outer membrane lipoprotein SlyB